MKKIILAILAIAGLVLTLIPAILVFTGNLSLEENKNYMLLGMVLWFSAAPFWKK